jgi:hypothetical protein
LSPPLPVSVRGIRFEQFKKLPVYYKGILAGEYEADFVIEDKISLGYFANDLGLGVRDLYAALEQRGLPTSNIDARSPSAGS